MRLHPLASAPLASQALVLLDRRLHRVLLVRRDRAEALLHGGHGPTAARKEHLQGSWSLLAHLLLNLLLGLLLHGLHAVKVKREEASQGNRALRSLHLGQKYYL